MHRSCDGRGDVLLFLQMETDECAAKLTETRRRNDARRLHGLLGRDKQRSLVPFLLYVQARVGRPDKSLLAVRVPGCSISFTQTLLLNLTTHLLTRSIADPSLHICIARGCALDTNARPSVEGGT